MYFIYTIIIYISINNTLIKRYKEGVDMSIVDIIKDELKPDDILKQTEYEIIYKKNINLKKKFDEKVIIINSKNYNCLRKIVR